MPDQYTDIISPEPPDTEYVSRTDDVCLVVGDWFVDEHWVCGVHRSSTSSRTGRSHLRALHSATSPVRAFCGAGRSALFLHHLYQHSDLNVPITSLIGLGFWHRADTMALTSLFDPRVPSQTPYRLTSPELVMPDGVELINMNDALNMNDGKYTEEEHICFRDNREYTTRIIRIYTHGERDQVVYDRLDWEPQAPRGEPASADVTWTGEKLAELSILLENQLRGRTVRAVIIKDMLKGVVNNAIIEWLVSLKLGQARWFVSSKRWRPVWLEGLGHKVDLRLLLVPQVSAQAALGEKDQKLSRWITHAGMPSKEAVDLIDNLATFTQAKNIFVLPEGFSALACACENGSVINYAVQFHTKPEKVTVDMGYASIVFPALVACLSDYQTECIELKLLINLVLRAAFEWVESEAQRVSDPRRWNPDPDGWKDNPALNHIKKLLHNQSPENTPKPFGDIRTRAWSVEREEWNQAFTGVGIVGRKDGCDGRFELWRAMLEVDGYVCCEESAREHLRHLLRGVQSFAKHPRYHASCMLVASPGSGKTFLAKRLAQTADLRFVPFNITQMRSKGDILECLDTIVATQAESTGRPLMVFIDEINAKLENAFVYGAFLTPLEDGTYVRSGRTFNIRPCLWVFAGTRHPKNEERVSSEARRGSEDDTPEKGSDFASRLTLGVINLTNSGRGQGRNAEDIQDQEMRATENVYLAVSMLRHEFPDVRLVSELVLRAFWELPQSTTVREIKHFVRRFGDIQYGEVTARNVPDRWPGDTEDRALNRWRRWRDNKSYTDKADVRIVTAVESEWEATDPFV